MSYARYGSDGGSSVYVFMCVSGYLECCGCSLLPEFDSFRTQETDAMLRHLDEHREAGQMVPDRCVLRLIEERDENDAWMREQAALIPTERTEDG